jgi:type I restriction enzyme S subunit
MSDVSDNAKWVTRQTRRLQEVKQGFTYFEEGDILFAKITPSTENGKGCLAEGLVNGIGFGSTEFHVIRAKNGNHPTFIYYWSTDKQLRLQAAARMVGSAGQQRVPEDFLCNYLVPLIDESEQTKIAQILSEVDIAIELTEALIAKYRRIKAGLVHDLLTRGIDEQGQLRDPKMGGFNKTALGRIPAEWEVITVETAGEVKLGRQRSPQHQTGRFSTPYLRVANVFDGWIDYSDVLEMDFTPSERITYGLQPGDILLNEGQSLELVGRSAIFPGPASKYCFQNTLIRFRSNGTTISEYCRAVFKYWLDTGRFQTIARQTTSVAHLGADRFAKMAFPRPPIEEQKRLVNILNAHDRLSEYEKQGLAKLQSLKIGLMQDLLTGKVSVAPLLVTEGGDLMKNYSESFDSRDSRFDH